MKEIIGNAVILYIMWRFFCFLIETWEIKNAARRRYRQQFKIK